MKLSILIVNWKSKDFLRRCLETVDQTCAELTPQVVVVDGGSFDGCGEMLAAEFPKVEFVQSAENIGFGRSNNLGFERVKGDMLLLLNPDTELRSGAPKELLAQLAKLPHAGVVGPRLFNSDGSIQTDCVQSLPTPLNQVLDLGLLRRMFPDSRLWGNQGAFTAACAVEVEAISGACMLMASETFRRVAGFSAQYFMYGEDMDLCAKVRKADLKVYHVPTAEVVHHGGGSSTGQFSNFSAVFMRHSIFLFIRSHQGNLAALTYRLLMAVSAVLRLSLLAPLCAFDRKGKSNAPVCAFKKWVAVLRWSAGLERWVCNRP